jgi:glucose/arabinose dehydrogenase
MMTTPTTTPRSRSRIARRATTWLALLVFSISGSACGEEPAPPETTVATPADRPPDANADQPAPDGDDQSSTTAESPPELPEIYLTRAFRSLSFERPVFLTHAGDGTNRLFVLEQSGRIRIFDGGDDDVERAGVFLDIRGKVRRRHNEEGLLSLAFHPDYESNGRFFVYYSASDPRRGVLSQFSVSADDPDLADPNSEKVILEVEQPYGNHNGSTVLFGPDDSLYMSLGDGGSANDPHNNGQDRSTLLGSILRIDINREADGKAYAIPVDNPFVDDPDARDEIWAYGLRNVWRMSFDAAGNLWAGDVGQNRWEEIDIIVRGGNYGWNLREGRHLFRRGSADVPLIDPIVDYGRTEGMCVTGGYVYRGSRCPDLVGAYVYGDYVSGRIWALRYRSGEMIAHTQILTGSQREHIASFGEGPDGELYICAFDRLDGREGRLWVMSEK